LRPRPPVRCIVLLNARAGPLHGHASQEEMRALAQAAGLDANFVATDSPDETRQTLRRLVADRAERVAVAGGDGTVALAAQELAYSDTVLGILPQGTANNFATALRLPQDLPSALRVLANGTVRAVDLGKVGDRYFTESAGVGLFADALTVYGARANKNVARAFYAILRVFLSARARRLHLILDGERVIERAVLCEVANSFRMAYAVPVAPGAKLTDGELDVVVVGDLNGVREMWAYYKAFRAQMHATLPKVHTFRAREVRIETRHTMNVHCDDKVIGTTPVTITAQPRALKVLVDTL
jgi:YegS/Rv2252/BmrU family lipid kinase